MCVTPAAWPFGQSCRIAVVWGRQRASECEQTCPGRTLGSVPVAGAGSYFQHDNAGYRTQFVDRSAAPTTWTWVKNHNMMDDNHYNRYNEQYEKENAAGSFGQGMW